MRAVGCQDPAPRCPKLGPTGHMRPVGRRLLASLLGRRLCLARVERLQMKKERTQFGSLGAADDVESRSYFMLGPDLTAIQKIIQLEHPWTSARTATRKNFLVSRNSCGCKSVGCPLKMHFRELENFLELLSSCGLACLFREPTTFTVTLIYLLASPNLIGG